MVVTGFFAPCLFLVTRLLRFLLRFAQEIGVNDSTKVRAHNKWGILQGGNTMIAIITLTPIPLVSKTIVPFEIERDVVLVGLMYFIVLCFDHGEAWENGNCCRNCFVKGLTWCGFLTIQDNRVQSEPFVGQLYSRSDCNFSSLAIIANE